MAYCQNMLRVYVNAKNICVNASTRFSQRSIKSENSPRCPKLTKSMKLSWSTSSCDLRIQINSANTVSSRISMLTWSSRESLEFATIKLRPIGKRCIRLPPKGGDLLNRTLPMRCMSRSQYLCRNEQKSAISMKSSMNSISMAIKLLYSPTLYNYP